MKNVIVNNNNHPAKAKAKAKANDSVPTSNNSRSSAGGGGGGGNTSNNSRSSPGGGDDGDRFHLFGAPDASKSDTQGATVGAALYRDIYGTNPGKSANDPGDDGNDSDPGDDGKPAAITKKDTSNPAAITKKDTSNCPDDGKPAAITKKDTSNRPDDGKSDDGKSGGKKDTSNRPDDGKSGGKKDTSNRPDDGKPAAITKKDTSNPAATTKKDTSNRVDVGVGKSATNAKGKPTVAINNPSNGGNGGNSTTLKDPPPKSKSSNDPNATSMAAALSTVATTSGSDGNKKRPTSKNESSDGPNAGLSGVATTSSGRMINSRVGVCVTVPGGAPDLLSPNATSHRPIPSVVLGKARVGKCCDINFDDLRGKLSGDLSDHNHNNLAIQRMDHFINHGVGKVSPLVGAIHNTVTSNVTNGSLVDPIGTGDQIQSNVEKLYKNWTLLTDLLEVRSQLSNGTVNPDEVLPSPTWTQGGGSSTTTPAGAETSSNNNTINSSNTKGTQSKREKLKVARKNAKNARDTFTQAQAAEAKLANENVANQQSGGTKRSARKSWKAGNKRAKNALDTFTQAQAAEAKLANENVANQQSGGTKRSAGKSSDKRPHLAESQEISQAISWQKSRSTLKAPPGASATATATATNNKRRRGKPQVTSRKTQKKTSGASASASATAAATTTTNNNTMVHTIDVGFIFKDTKHGHGFIAYIDESTNRRHFVSKTWLEEVLRRAAAKDPKLAKLTLTKQITKFFQKYNPLSNEVCHDNGFTLPPYKKITTALTPCTKDELDDHVKWAQNVYTSYYNKNIDTDNDTDNVMDNVEDDV